MKTVVLVVVFSVALAGPASAQLLIFADGFEWGSTCAWSNPWYVDADGDGWGVDGTGVEVSCPEPLNLAPVPGDCDDLDELIYPGSFEACDGIDNDCDPGTADGFDESWFGETCDGADTDLCEEGAFSCLSLAQVCTDDSDDNAELCNGMDDDCDPASADGSEDPLNGAACDGSDSDLCNEGTYSCVAGSLTCSDTTSGTLDVCNGLDDDCDPASQDGSEDPQFGSPCDGNDTDLCDEGTIICAAGSLTCSDTTSDLLDVCNGLDDDCDPASADGSEDPLNGAACDGSDSDLCNEGTYSCVAGSLVCSDTTSGTLDVCNGADDDCDPASADGSEDPLIGAACDGSDSDLCNEGTHSCVAGSLTCSDTTSDNLDVCNGTDDDCDPASADGSEDPLIGAACDGSDSDLCNEGTHSCVAGSLTCSDTTSGTLDVCNGADDDCDPASADGSEDPLNGAACDGSDSDLCNEGINICAGGAISCTDTSGDTVEICGNGLDEDCDGTADDGCCDHDPCESGGPLDGSTCGPCVAAVCTIDPWCCTTVWDEFCQEKVYKYCNTTCDGAGIGCTECGTCSGIDPLNPAPTCGADHHCKPQAGIGSPGLCIEGVGTSGYYDTCADSADCVADATCVDIGAATWAVCLQWCRMGESDCTGDGTCVAFATAKYIDSQEWGTCSDVPADWVCPDTYFGDLSCDCGCGAFDPDCIDSTVDSCDYCGSGCGTGTCPANIDPNENWHC